MKCCVAILAVSLCCWYPMPYLGQSANNESSAPLNQATPQQSETLNDSEPSSSESTSKEDLLRLLPESVSKDLELDAWAWIGALHQPDHDDYWDADLSLSVTKSFEQRVALTLQGDVLSANGDWRAELRQGFISALLSEENGTIFTLGKFNADFGVEPRDFWNRRTGTTSLLFGAQPQDLIGAMLTLPLGDSGIKIRPFISADFQGDYYFDQSPSVGLKVDFQPSSDLNFALTQWIGPGIALTGGEPWHSPYPLDSYGENPEAVISNWQGPHLLAERAGTLYFFDVKATWNAFPDLTLAAEFLLGTTNTDMGTFGWHGWLGLATYDLSDRAHLFGRFSYLDDPDWLITGFFQTRREVSCGFGYEILSDVEIRGEYRRDFSNIASDVDTLSIHLTMTY